MERNKILSTTWGMVGEVMVQALSKPFKRMNSSPYLGRSLELCYDWFISRSKSFHLVIDRYLNARIIEHYRLSLMNHQLSS